MIQFSFYKVANNKSIVTESNKHKLVGSTSNTLVSPASDLNKKLTSSSHKHHYQNYTKHNSNKKVASSSKYKKKIENKIQKHLFATTFML